MADMSVSGIASGIDWDSMIEKILETARKPAYVQLNKRDNLELKKSLFEEFQVALQAVQRSLSSLKLPSTYTAKGVDIARLDNNTSHKSVLTATANADAEIDLHTVEVAQIAKAQISRSNTFSPSTALGAAAAGSFNINVGGRTFTINVGAADTLQNISDNINQLLKTQIPPVGITASVLFDRLILQSDSTGMGSTTITSNTMTTSNGAVIFADGAGNPYTPPIDMSHGVAKVNVGGAIYTQGKDFDILAGNQIVWRTTIPSVATTGDTYQLECQLNAGSIYTNAITRGSGKIDDNALPVSASPLNPSDIKIQSMGGSPYEYRSGVDYIIGGADGRDIEWLDGGLRPPAGVAYEIVYTAPTGGPNITVDVKRNNTDTIATPFATLDPVVVDIVDSAGRIYKRGVDFELAQDPSFATNTLVQWKGRNPLKGGDSYDFRNSTAAVVGAGQRSDTDTPVLGQFFGGTPLSNVDVYLNGTLLTPGTHYNYPIGPDTLQWLSVTSLPAPPPPTNYTVEYTYDANPFTLTNVSGAPLTFLGLDAAANQTAPQDAILVVNGDVFKRSSNLIGESYGNEIIKGLTLDVKGPGEVELDVFLDAEVAVKTLQDFITAYNDVLTWINTRMTEKEVDAAKKATLDSDDFRMKWGLLNGNSLLRASKNNLRRLTSQVYAPSFASRASSGSVWGANSLGELIPIVTPPAYQPPSEIFTITVDGRTLSVKVDPGQTLAQVVANINTPNWNPTVDGNSATAKNPLFYDEDGALFAIPLARAKVGPNSTLVVETIDPAKTATLGGATSMLSTLRINFKYTTLSEVGIKLPSYGTATEEAKVGTLEFDVDKFLTAIESNPHDLAALMTTFAGQTDTYMNDMLGASQKEVAPGITTARGAVIREMNAIDDEIKRIDKYLTEFDRRLENKRESLFKQFSSAEENLAKLMEQASWLASVTSQLQAAGK